MKTKTIETPSSDILTHQTQLTKREFCGIIFRGSAALALPALVTQMGCASANENGPPSNPPVPPSNNRFNPNGFPDETRDQIAILECYGDPRDDTNIIRVPSPFPMKISGLEKSYRKHLWAHRKVADSLATVLQNVLEQYGELEIDRLGLNIFGGDHIDRKMTGTNRWSLHAYAIAFDFHPQQNQYRWGHDRALFARPEYDLWWHAWKQEGWYALGPERGFDYMHVQAAIRNY